MTTDPAQIRHDVDALLAHIPSLDTFTVGDSEIEVIGRLLEEAHQVLVRALESVEKG